VQAAVNGDVTQLEADDPVVPADCFDGDVVEHTGVDPLVTPPADCGVRITLFEHSRSASSHEQPVTSRTSITSKQSRSAARGR